MKVKEESENVGLKLNIQETKIMASGPITSWQIDRENNGNSDRLFLGAPKSLQMVTAVMQLKDTCSRNKSYDQSRQHIKKQRHYFAIKVPFSQRYGFSSSYVWMWELLIKKPDCQRIDAFELWCWRRLFRVPWTARRSNQFILKEISHEYSLEGLMLKLKLQYSGHLIRRTDSLAKTLMLGKLKGGGEGDNKGWNGCMASPTRQTWVWVSSGSWWWIGEAWCAVVHGFAKSQTWLSDWTECNVSGNIQQLREYHLYIFTNICEISSGRLLYNEGSQASCSVMT